MTKISPGTIIVGIFAVLFGLVGAYAVRQSLTPKPVEVAAAPAEPRPILVPVAAVDLEPGRPLNLGDVAIMRVLPEEAQARGFTGAYMRDSQQIIGRILRQGAVKGGTFFPEMFYPQGMGPSLAERLKPGYRAVTIPIHNDAAVAGMATSGSLVDVILRTRPTPQDPLPETTVTLLEGVEVLALNRVATPGVQAVGDVRGRNEMTVTLAVSPKQANALRVVEGRGELSLAMRNPEDRAISSDSAPQTLGGLLGLVPAQRFQTEIYRGTTRSATTFSGSPPHSYVSEQFPVRAEVEDAPAVIVPAAAPKAALRNEPRDLAASRE
jgi:pilus assembly protein CpaB